MIYTCPMHPEIEQDHPGECPKCGMTLEPKTVAAGIFPSSFRRHGEVDLYFEAAAVITTLVLLGQLLEAKARSRTGQAIKALLGLAAKTAHRLRSEERRVGKECRS